MKKILIKPYLKYFFIILAFLIPKSSYAQIPDSLYMNIQVSNYFPEIDEPVTLTIEFALKNTCDPCEVLVGYYPYKKIEVVSGETHWKGVVKAGEKIQRNYILKFKEARVVRLNIYVYQGSLNWGFGKGLNFHVGGGIEENAYVSLYRRYLQYIDERNSLFKINTTPKERQKRNYLEGLLEPPSKIDSIAAAIIVKNPERGKINPAYEQRKDSLVAELRNQYKKLYRQIKPAAKDKQDKN